MPDAEDLERTLSAGAPDGGDATQQTEREGGRVVAKPSESEDSKLSERGIHSLTQSVTDEASRPISEVDDEAQSDRADVSSENSILQGSHSAAPERSRRDPKEEDLKRSKAGADRRIESENGGQICEQVREPHSIELRGRIVSLNERLREAYKKKQERLSEGDQGLSSQASQEVHDEQEQEQESIEGELKSIGRQFLQESDSVELSSSPNSSEVEKDDAVSYLGTLATEAEEEDEKSARQPSLGPDRSVFYPEQLDPEDAIKSLEDRIRNARENQDQEWDEEREGNGRRPTESVDSSSQPRRESEEVSSSGYPELEEISADQSEGYAETLLSSRFRGRKRVQSIPEEIGEEGNEPLKKKPGAGEAVLLGALASGVNKPTWFVIRAVLVALVASLILLLYVAIQSDSQFVLLNVLFLIGIAGGLILLLSWYISEIGLVSVDKQMAELNLTNEVSKVEQKTL